MNEPTWAQNLTPIVPSLSDPSKSQNHPKAGRGPPLRDDEWMDAHVPTRAAEHITFLGCRRKREEGGLAWARDRECHPDRIHFGHGDSRGHPDTVRFLSPGSALVAGAPATMGGRLSSLPATCSPHLSATQLALLRLWMICVRVLPAWIRSAEAGAARFHISV